MAAPQVFVSYSRDDMALARQVQYALAQNGANVWMDADAVRPGDDIALSVKEAIDAADALVLLLSRKWMSSPYSNFELAAALARESTDRPITVIPIVTERGVRPPPLLADVAYLDATRGRLSEDDLAEVVQAVRSDDDPTRGVDARTARAEKLASAASRLRLIQEGERAYAASREQSLRAAWGLTLLLSTVMAVAALVSQSVGVVRFFLPALVGVLGTAVGFYYGRGEDR